jgi:cytoplasmic iron level regulating protein YaaA (DUF328/UPF0246 family)
MILVLSPAKTQDFATPPHIEACSQPALLQESAKLVKRLRALTIDQLAGLMGISDNLAALNAGRFAQWRPPFTPANAKQAVLAFTGDAYQGLDPAGLDAGDLAFAQDHLRILSGLYGCLRPLDLIQPYRLEMGTRLANPRGAELYAFWGDRLAGVLNQALAADPGAPVLVNLASAAYFKAVDTGACAGRILTPVFEDFQNGAYRVVGFHAKRARGMMCRFAIQRRLADPEGLKAFRAGGYAFAAKASSADRWVFRRNAA